MNLDSSQPRSNQTSIVKITNVHLPFREKVKEGALWTVECRGGRVSSISLFDEEGRGAAQTSSFGDTTTTLDGQGGLLLPSFCHPHVHLDKCYILDRCGDLLSGDFAEALAVTNRAKAGFLGDVTDLYTRGARLIRESVSYGVTCIRAHVEVDTAVRLVCLETALRLKEDLASICDIQISVFAQEALYHSPGDETPGENHNLLKQAIISPGVEVIGSAPYVEPSIEHAKKNISLIFDLADAQLLSYVDFHLDYNLDPTSQPLIYEVISQAKTRYGHTGPRHANPNRSWTRPQARRERQSDPPCITIGHATRLALFSPSEWTGLVSHIGDLPIRFVSLPQSDIYMQGRSGAGKPLGAPRGTLNVPQLAKHHQLHVAMSVNNVENAFTPQGSMDPLSLCTFGVAIFQCITSEDTRILLQSISTTSKQCIGVPRRRAASDEGEDELVLELAPRIGDNADFVLLHGPRTVQAAVLNPTRERTTIKGGNVVARIESQVWVAR